MEHWRSKGREMLRWTVGWFLVLTLATPSLVAQVEPTIIRGAPACATCELIRERVVVLHDRTYPGGAFGDWVTPFALSDGRFLVRAGPGRKELYLAAPSGEVVRQIGSVGQGPGEYLDPDYLAETPSAVFVFDGGQLRLTELSKPDLDLIDTYPLPTSPSGSRPLVFADGVVVMKASLYTRDGFGYPFHAFDPSVDSIRSFGPQGATPGPRTLAASGDSAFWVVDPIHRYRAEKWHRDGHLLAVVEREADWFRPGDEVVEEGERYHRLAALHEDAEGRLCARVKELTRSASGGNLTTQESGASIVEILDPTRGTLIATRRFPDVFESSMGQRLYHHVRDYDDLGRREVHIWRYRVRDNHQERDRIMPGSGGSEPLCR